MQLASSNLGLRGNMSMRVINRAEDKRQRMKRIRRSIFWWHVRNWITHRWRELPFYAVLACYSVLKLFVPALVVMHGKLSLKKIDANGDVWDYGVVGRHLIVTAGKVYLTGCLDNTNEAENLKYHGYGTGTGAAAAGDTGLGTELTTEYAVNSTRPTGSQAKASNVYTTVGTLVPDSGGTLAITEWGLFSASSSTTLFDRQVFSAVNVVASADSLQTTYALTVG